MPGEQLEVLLDNPELREAVTVVLDQLDDPDDELRWADVSDSLTSGQWGRLIQENVLVSGTTGFAVAKPERLREQLHGEPADQVSFEAIETKSWSRYDKLAGLTAIAFFAGYWNNGIRDVIASIDNVALEPLLSLFPFHVVVLILAIITGLYSTLLQSKLMDQDAMQAYQERMSEITDREEAARERGDDEALEAIQEEKMEAAKDQLGMFKLQFRPMVWIMLLTIPVFLWLRWKVRGGHLGSTHGLVVPLAGHVSYQQGLLGPMPTWIVWYFVCSVASRQIIQKTLNIQTSPSSSS